MSRDMPDWRNPDDYPDPSSTSLLQWAWEFFRRNPDYHRDYAEFKALARETQITGIYTDGTISRFCLCTPTAMPGETEADFFRRGGREIKAPRGYFRERYRLLMSLGLPNPHESLSPPGVFDTQAIRLVKFEHVIDPDWHRGLLPKRPGELAVIIDFDLPLEAQFERIKDFGPKSTFKRRNHVAKFPFYLRAYDAKVLGCTAEEIADQFEHEQPQSEVDAEEVKTGTHEGRSSMEAEQQKRDPDRVQAVYNYLAAARDLITADYWKIAASEISK